MDYSKFIASIHINVIEVLSLIDMCQYGVVFIVDNENKLVGSVSDGDVRRWIIKSNDLKANVEKFMNKTPKVVLEDERDCAKIIQEKYGVNCVPVVNSNFEIKDIIIFDKVIEKIENNGGINEWKVPVIIMAGGRGTRLYPYTKILPKPLIPIGDTPILERIINKFYSYGIKKYYLTVNYKKNMIKSYFNDLSPDYEIIYVEETKPLGTGGSIRLIEDSFNVPIIVANCDQLINANYKDLYEYHEKSGNIITVVSSLKNITVPYGVLKTRENGELVSMEEKPTLSYFINTGMYVINPETIALIPDDQIFHMTHLIEEVRKQGAKVGMYPISEEAFLDMGEFSEMKRMEEKLNVLSEK